MEEHKKSSKKYKKLYKLTMQYGRVTKTFYYVYAVWPSYLLMITFTLLKPASLINFWNLVQLIMIYLIHLNAMRIRVLKPNVKMGFISFLSNSLIITQVLSF
jgi:hypothetical protein